MATRLVDGPKPCPRCGARMLVTEETVRVDHPTPIWRMTSCRCSNACRLVADDFPVDYDE